MRMDASSISCPTRSIQLCSGAASCGLPVELGAVSAFTVSGIEGDVESLVDFVIVSCFLQMGDCALPAFDQAFLRWRVVKHRNLH